MKTQRRLGFGLVLACVFVLAGLGAGNAMAVPLSVTVTDLSPLGSLGSQAYAINDSGQVVGWGEAANGLNRAALWQIGFPVFVDADGDGVADTIDTGGAPGEFADTSLTPPTTGVIVDAAGLEVRVEDADDPADGVKVTVAGTGSAKATLSVCGGFQLELAAGSTVIVTCGSVTVEVVTGEAEVVLGDGLATVSVPQGVIATVSENPDGTFAVENLGGGAVTVTVDGIVTTIAPGQTKTVAAWDSVGFSAPVDNPDTLNPVKAGQAVPFKWRLLDANGNAVTTLASATLTAVSLSCSLGTTADLLEEVAGGGSGLQNLGDGYYQLNWKTPKTCADSCKTLKLDLGDGVTHDALFKFTR